MSKAEELAKEWRKTMPREVALLWGEEAAGELRRLEQVERELEALKVSIGEPVAWIVEGQSPGGGVARYLAWSKSGAGQVPAPLRTQPIPLYAIKEVK